MKPRNYIHSFAVMMSVAVLLMVSAGVWAADAAPPSATLHMKETQAGLIISGDWGHGTLKYKGESHMFHMGGGKLGGGGISVAEVDGDVYHMHSLEDFPGVYFKAEAGITIVEGVSGTWIKNDKGVSIHLKGGSKGVALAIGVGGLKIGF